MADLPSKTQLDKLGDRLRAGSRDEADIRALDEYRRSFRSAYESVAQTLQSLELQPNSRPAKTTTAIVDKLNRQAIRLTQIQDIAGIRVVVPNVSEQNRIVQLIRGTFDRVVVSDRRVKPSHGYRAVHVIVTQLGKSVEIQIRTKEQHLWAELSEKLSDLVDPAVKYGGGPAETQDALRKYSEFVRQIEDFEFTLIEERVTLVEREIALAKLSSGDPHHKRASKLIEEMRTFLQETELSNEQHKKDLASLLEDEYNELLRGER